MIAWLLAVALAAPAAAAPKDFDAFWLQTKKELAAVPADLTLEPDAAHSDGEAACFKASYRGLGGALIRARYCRPNREGRFPAVLISPWYSQGAIPAPSDLAKKGIAALWYQARGFEVDQASYPVENSWYILDGIDSPRTYVYRGILAEALRGLDALASRPEVDPHRLGVMGASQGGGLSLLAAGLDRRVKAAAADFPFLSDWPDSIAAPHSPYADVRKYVCDHPEKKDAVLRTVAYFDTLAVAGRIRVPVLVNAGLKDQTCPAEGIEKVYRAIKSRDKKLKEYPDADHADRGAERWQAMIDFLAAKL